MKRKIKVLEAARLFNIIAPLKTQCFKVQASKFSLYSLVRQLRPIAEGYEKEMLSIAEKEKSQQVQAAYERLGTEGLSPGETKECNAVVACYNQAIRTFELKLFEEEKEIDTEGIGKEELERLIDTNNLDAASAALVVEFLLK